MITYVYPDVQLERCNLTEYKDFPERVFIASEKGFEMTAVKTRGIRITIN